MRDFKVDKLVSYEDDDYSNRVVSAEITIEGKSLILEIDEIPIIVEKLIAIRDDED